MVHGQMVNVLLYGCPFRGKPTEGAAIPPCFFRRSPEGHPKVARRQSESHPHIARVSSVGLPSVTKNALRTCYRPTKPAKPAKPALNYKKKRLPLQEASFFIPSTQLREQRLLFHHPSPLVLWYQKLTKVDCDS